MAKSKPKDRVALPGLPAGASQIEHDGRGLPVGFTAWHHFLARALKKTRGPGFDIDCFVKLGALPLEADAIILHLDKNADISEFAEYFDFLLPALRRCVVIEYKSPDDRLTLSDFDTVRAYAMLAKRSYGIAHDDDVAVVMMYSHAASDFFAGCAKSGFPFLESQPGLRHSTSLPLGYHAIDLLELGERRPEHPINLLSARRRTYGKKGLPRRLGPFAVLYETVFFEELKQMSRLQVPGTKELLGVALDAKELILSQMSLDEAIERFKITPESFLRKMSPEKFVHEISPAERARLRELLDQEDAEK